VSTTSRDLLNDSALFDVLTGYVLTDLTETHDAEVTILFTEIKVFLQFCVVVKLGLPHEGKTECASEQGVEENICTYKGG
jgi:hypothetical protein